VNFSHIPKFEILGCDRDKLSLNERLNGYELRFGLGLSPNGSDPRLTGRIQPERRVRPIGWLGRATSLLGCLGHAWRGRGGGEAGQPGRRLGFGPLGWI
jgi:hypothetical protein